MNDEAFAVQTAPLERHCQISDVAACGSFIFTLHIEELPRIKGFRFPWSVVGYAAWAYHRFALGLHNIENLLVERGVMVSYRIIRDWVNRFSPRLATSIRCDQRVPADKWHLDILVQSQRNKAAATRFLRKLRKRWGTPRVMVTDKLRYYGPVRTEIEPGREYRQNKGLKIGGGIVSTHTTAGKDNGTTQFPAAGAVVFSVHDQTASVLRPKRHRMTAKSNRHARNDAFDLWAGRAAELAAGVLMLAPRLVRVPKTTMLPTRSYGETRLQLPRFQREASGLSVEVSICDAC